MAGGGEKEGDKNRGRIITDGGEKEKGRTM